MKTAGLYGRVSTKRQGEEGTSLTTQEAKCQAFAVDSGFTVSSDYVIFEQGSGADPLRPGFLKLQHAVAEHLVDAVIVYSHDRLARDPLHMMNFVELCDESGVDLLFVNGPSGNTDEDKLVQYLMGYVGMKERKHTAERTVRGKLEIARSQGRLPNGVGRGIYGYDYDPVTKTRSINKLEANTIVRIFQWFSDGRSRNYIATNLNREGIPSKNGCKWHPLTVGRMLTNESYIGVDYYNRTRTKMHKGGRRTVTERPREEWVELIDFSPPIVSEEIFQLVRQRMDMPRPASNGGKRRYFLTGFVRCRLCGTPVCGASMQKGKYRYYRCRATVPTSVSPATCKALYIRADHFEKTVWGHLSDTLKDPAVVIAELQDFMKTGEGELGREIAHLRKEILKCKQTESNFLSLANHDAFDPDLLKNQVAPISALRKRHEEQLNQLEQQQALNDDAKEAERRITEYCRMVSEGLDNLDHEGKIAMLSAFNVRVAATRDDVSITAVVNPAALDQEITTIERTSASLRACRNGSQGRTRA